MFNEVRIVRPNPKTIVFSRNPLVGVVVFSIAFVVGMYLLRTQVDLSGVQGDILVQIRYQLDERPNLYGGVALLLFIVVGLGKSLFDYYEGEKFTFDGNRFALLIDDEHAASFREVAHIEVRRVVASEQQGKTPVEREKHHLSITLKSGDHYSLYSSSDFDATMKLAGELAAITRGQIVKTNYEATIREWKGAV